MSSQRLVALTNGFRELGLRFLCFRLRVCCTALNGSVRISVGRTVYLYIRVLRFDSSWNRAIRVQMSTVPLLGLFFLRLFLSACGISAAFFLVGAQERWLFLYLRLFFVLHPLALSAPGRGPQLRLRRFLPSFLSVTPRLVDVWVLVVAFGSVAKVAFFSPHPRFSC